MYIKYIKYICALNERGASMVVNDYIKYMKFIKF